MISFTVHGVSGMVDFPNTVDIDDIYLYYTLKLDRKPKEREFCSKIPELGEIPFLEIYSSTHSRTAALWSLRRLGERLLKTEQKYSLARLNQR
jgi:hypothetical protein